MSNSIGLSGRIFLTGGSGYIGRALMRQAQVEGWSAKFTVYSRDEYKQYLCAKKFPDATYILGTILDQDRLTLAMHGADCVIHAAAVKSVPGAEHNVSECISVNVIGTHAVIAAARAALVSRVVLISTDKACAAETTYGATKLLLERMAGEAMMLGYASTEFVVVRYGNVIGSTASVVPMFRDQFKATGSVTVTDPAMTRFWMPYQDAVDLISHAAEYGRPGHILVPSPQAMALGDLIQAIVPGAQQTIIGLRSGEKMHEKLLTLDESRWLVDSGNDLYFELPTPVFRQGLPPNDRPFEYSSEHAFKMDGEYFLDYANESEHV